MAWTMTDFTTTTVLSAGSFIKRSLKAYDYAECECGAKFDLDTYVVILNGDTEIFWGWIKAIDERHAGKWYKYTVSERAIELKDIEVDSGGSHNFVVSSAAVDSIVATILYNCSGWSVGTTDTTVVDKMAFYYLNAGDALQKLLEDLQGKSIWFDNKNQYVYWGTVNHDLSGSPLAYTKKVETSNSVRRNIAYVRVLGTDDKYTGEAGTPASGAKGVTYRYTNAKSNEECADMAATILTDLGSPKLRYDVTLKPNYTIDVCDLVSIDSVDYIVYDVKLSQTQCVIGVNGYGNDVFDVYGSALTEISGEIVAGSDASWSGGNTNVAANGAAYTEYIWEIKDVSMISNAKLDATIGNFIKSANVSANTDYLSAVTPLLGSVVYTANENISSGGNNYYPYDGSNRYVSRTGLTDGFQYGLLNFGATVAYSSDSTSQYIRLQPQYSYTGTTWYNITDGSTTFYTDIYLARRKARVTGSSSFLTSVTLSKTRDTNNRYVASTSGGSPTTPESGIVNDVSIGHGSSTVNDTSNDIVYIPVSFTCLIPGSSNYTTLYVRVLITNYTNGTVTVINSSGLLQIVQRHTHPVTTTYDKTTTGTPPATVTIKVNSGSDTTLTPGNPKDIQSLLKTGKNIIYVKTPSGSGNQCSVNPTITYQTLGKS